MTKPLSLYENEDAYTAMRMQRAGNTDTFPAWLTGGVFGFDQRIKNLFELAPLLNLAWREIGKPERDSRGDKWPREDEEESKYGFIYTVLRSLPTERGTRSLHDIVMAVAQLVANSK